MTEPYSSCKDVAIYLGGQLIGTASEIRFMIDQSGNDQHFTPVDRRGVGTYTCEGTLTLYPGARHQLAEYVARSRKDRGPEVRRWLRRLREQEPTGSGRTRRLFRAIRRREAKLRRRAQIAWWSR